MSLYVHHLESEKQELSDMTTYLKKKSTAVAESIKQSQSVAGNLEDPNLGFNSPKVQKKPKLKRPRSGLLYTPRDSETPKDHTPNRVPQSARVNSSASHFQNSIQQDLKSGKDIEVPVPPPTPRDPPETREKIQGNNMVGDEDGKARKESNDSFKRDSRQARKKFGLQRYSTIYESFDEVIGEDDLDFLLLNSKFEGTIVEEDESTDKKTDSQPQKEAKTANKLNSTKKKLSKSSKEDKTPSFNITDPSDLSSLVGKVSLQKLTQMHQKLLENQNKDPELHPYVQDYLKNQVFTKYPANSKETMITDHPVHCDPNEKISVIKIVRDLVGKDITKIALPCYLNEPGSLLNRIVEDVVLKSILDRASKEPDQYLRLGLAAAVLFHFLSVIDGRSKKPINPLLGETLEMIWGDAHGIAEQVSHHPPISAKFWKTKDYSVLIKKKILIFSRGLKFSFKFLFAHNSC